MNSVLGWTKALRLETTVVVLWMRRKEYSAERKKKTPSSFTRETTPGLFDPSVGNNVPSSFAAGVSRPPMPQFPPTVHPEAPWSQQKESCDELLAQWLSGQLVT